MELRNKLEDVRRLVDQAFVSANTDKELEQARVLILGRQGKIAELMDIFKTCSLEDKKALGPFINGLKEHAEKVHLQRKQELQEASEQALLNKVRFFDVTAAYPEKLPARLHPYSHIIEQIEDIFITMGYEIADGQEVETDYYNFEALNIPADHPARDMYDTFWLSWPHYLLRTHTSPVQIHALERKKLPLAVIAPGRCYRHEATDASHDIMFMQTEGLFIDKGISMSHLFATAKTCLQAIFEKKDIDIRVRPGFFPFVEPGVEIDMSCPFCKHGCSVCKKSTWIEVFPAGLVHPNVLKYSGIDPTHYSGFAFGFGLTRIAMIKYGINDIRLFHSGKVEFLDQF